MPKRGVYWVEGLEAASSLAELGRPCRVEGLEAASSLVELGRPCRAEGL